MHEKLKFILFSLIQILIAQFSICDKLRFVFGIFRHGARAPWKSIDKNNVDLFGSKWVGDSQLTSVGIRQHYLLGYKNKQKYFNQLNITQYNPNEIAIYSTDTDRTIMSVYSELFGMFRPGTGSKLSEEQKQYAEPPIKSFDFSEKKKFLKDDVLAYGVNPLPVHLFDKYANYFHLYDPKLCPGVVDYQEQNKNSEKFQNYSNNIIKDYGEKIIKLVNYSNITDLKSYEKMYFVFDTFIANLFDGRNLSKFNETGINLEEFKNLTIDFLTWDQFFINYGDKESLVARMSFSPVFRYLLELIDNRIKIDDQQGFSDNYTSLNPKILLYSAHDTSLAAMNVFLTYMFGAEKVKSYYTYFASSFYFELYKNETKNINNQKTVDDNIDDDYYLNVLFNEQNIFGKPILYSEFKNQIKDKLNSTEEVLKFCKLSADDDNDNWKIGLIIMLITLIIMCFVFGYLIYYYSKKSYIKQIDSDKDFTEV